MNTRIIPPTRMTEYEYEKFNEFRTLRQMTWSTLTRKALEFYVDISNQRDEGKTFIRLINGDKHD